MDSGKFDYPYALCYSTDKNKEIFNIKIKEQVDYSIHDNIKGLMTFIVCFNNKETLDKFVNETGITGYKVLQTPEEIENAFCDVLDLMSAR